MLKRLLLQEQHTFDAAVLELNHELVNLLPDRWSCVQDTHEKHADFYITSPYIEEISKSWETVIRVSLLADNLIIIMAEDLHYDQTYNFTINDNDKLKRGAVRLSRIFGVLNDIFKTDAGPYIEENIRKLWKSFIFVPLNVPAQLEATGRWAKGLSSNDHFEIEPEIWQACDNIIMTFRHENNVLAMGFSWIY
jgi:hypothetical protein